MRRIVLSLAAMLLLSAASFVSANATTTTVMNAVRAGELVIDPPTLINLGFEWLILSLIHI